jgi:predicted enzyme related to lactoylglutathione lyase
MIAPEDELVISGICNDRNVNAGIPPVWIMYINVANLDESIEKVVQRGGEVIHGPRNMGEKARYCIIKDPAGAFCGLFEHGE